MREEGGEGGKRGGGVVQPLEEESRTTAWLRMQDFKMEATRVKTKYLKMVVERGGGDCELREVGDWGFLADLKRKD